jgi:NTP pyrophosphatase (non-canonical NTP hydrolase)
MTNHPVLVEHPTIPDMQAYIAATIKHRGFDEDTLQDQFIMLTEEVGELAKALRKHHGGTIAADSAVGLIENEAADVFWMLVCVCNKLGIDLETAVRGKEELNKQRTWR